MSLQNSITAFRAFLDAQSKNGSREWEGGRGRINYFPASRQNGNCAEEILQGLSGPQKFIAPKYFYDEAGSNLFERICKLPEYYLTRTEDKIIKANLKTLKGEINPKTSLMEFGSGSSEKTCYLLDIWSRAQGESHYIPVDISASALESSVPQLLTKYADLWTTGLNISYQGALSLLRENKDGLSLSFAFLGSNIGNLLPKERSRFFSAVTVLMDKEGVFIFGADLQKDRRLLEAAYNDSAGVTSEFNLNLLTRLNRQIHADFIPEQFRHRAFYNDREGRIEMHLESMRRQTVRVAGKPISLEKGETIHTEYSHKFDIGRLTAELKENGLRVKKVITDPEKMFSVWVVSLPPPGAKEP